MSPVRYVSSGVRPRGTSGPARPRRGILNPLLVFLLVLFFAALAFAVDIANLWATRAEMQRAADAAALAATQALVDDALLRRVPGEIQAVIGRAWEEAGRYAQANPIQGRSLALEPNPDNDANGDVVLGYLESPRSRRFVVADQISDPNDAVLHLLNAVRVMMRQTRARGNPAGLYWGRLLHLQSADVQVAATAMRDHAVMGFRPVGARPVPLVPIALLSDPTASVPESWEAQVEGRRGIDEYRFEPETQQFVPDPRGDGLFEMSASPAMAESQVDSANACLLRIGEGDFPALCRQIAEGLTATDLSSFREEFVFQGDGTLPVDAGLLAALGEGDRGRLRAALEQLRIEAQPRCWPLFSAFDLGEGKAVVTRFVAARVVRVDPPTAESPLNIVLQPTMMSTATAVTQPRPASGAAASVLNPYICKVRLVE